NPTGNNHGALLMLSSFTKALGTRNRFSSGSQDANPRIVTSYELYGSSISIPIPDIDRTDYFLCLGGNPMISNGSVMTAPDMRRRLRAVRERGGKIVVVDPRRTETAKEANEHVAIRPGGDAAFLLAMAQVLVEREGGPMLTTPAFDIGRVARMGGLDGHDRWQSRVRGLPETLGDLPATVLADEIETPGQGQIRAMVTLAGNPVLSVPNGKRLA